MWSLVPGECLQIHLEKTDELYWTALFEGEQEIDKTKLDTSRDISDFDQQTQADFQKVMYDHHQKLQGKPTSDEQVCWGDFFCNVLLINIPCMRINIIFLGVVVCKSEGK